MSALADHLWQSTLFALAAGLLAWALRRNRAQQRYWLWLAASLKFLVPFSLLAIAGSWLARMLEWDTREAPVYRLAGGIYGPFTRSFALADSMMPRGMAASHFLSYLPMLLAVAWLCGFAVVLAVWVSRWRGVARAIRKATPLRVGREIEALRRLERKAGVRVPVPVLQTDRSFEPAVFGVLSPVLLWPEGISAHFDDAHLEGVLAHELWHVRRRDNLTATLHAAVQAVFWFHPLTWWLGAKLVEERERACDEKVLEWGSERAKYAESILKTCQFCVGFSLTCLSSVTGADLKKRIVQVMTHQATAKLRASQKALLGTAATLAVTLPVVFGLLNPDDGLDALLANAQATRAGRFAADTPARGHWYRLLSVRSVAPSRPAEPCPARGDIRLMCGACQHPQQYSEPNLHIQTQVVQTSKPIVLFSEDTRPWSR